MKQKPLNNEISIQTSFIEEPSWQEKLRAEQIKLETIIQEQEKANFCFLQFLFDLKNFKAKMSLKLTVKNLEIILCSTIENSSLAKYLAIMTNMIHHRDQ